MYDYSGYFGLILLLLAALLVILFLKRKGKNREDEAGEE
jgi:hypothetical protein